MDYPGVLNLVTPVLKIREPFLAGGRKNISERKIRAITIINFSLAGSELQ